MSAPADYGGFLLTSTFKSLQHRSSKPGRPVLGALSLGHDSQSSAVVDARSATLGVPYTLSPAPARVFHPSKLQISHRAIYHAASLSLSLVLFIDTDGDKRVFAY